MPVRDRTGPRGLGPKTGRGLGDCDTDEDFLPRGQGLGRGVGQGLGRGAGRGLGYYEPAEQVKKAKKEGVATSEDIVKNILE